MLSRSADWVRRGIATALVLDALANAREREVARIEVTANGHALAFYESVGFVWDGMSQTQFGRGFRMHVDIPLSSSGAPAVDRSSRADQVHGVPVSTSSTARWEAVSSGLITDFASVADAMADRSWLRSSGSPGIVGTVIYETYLIG